MTITSKTIRLFLYVSFFWPLGEVAYAQNEPLDRPDDLDYFVTPTIEGQFYNIAEESQEGDLSKLSRRSGHVWKVWCVQGHPCCLFTGDHQSNWISVFWKRSRCNGPGTKSQLLRGSKELAKNCHERWNSRLGSILCHANLILVPSNKNRGRQKRPDGSQPGEWCADQPRPLSYSTLFAP